MIAEKWEQIKALFEDVFDLSPEERQRFLKRLNLENPEAASEVIKLLRSYEEAGEFLLQPCTVPSEFLEGFETEQYRFAPGDVLCGRFRIIELMGHGGMGEVYKAWDEEREDHVALKTLRSQTSIGVPTRKAGTYTCVVANSQGQPFAVTAGHVVQGFQGRIAPGVQVLQPPTPSPTIPSGQSLLLGQTIDGFFGNTPQGFLDFALLQILPSRTAVSDALDSLPVRRQIMSSAFVINNAISVTKFGAFTGRTEGVFSAPVTSIVIGGIIVRNVLEFKGINEALFGDQGDSGALVVSASPGSQGLIVGILFATMPPTPDAPSGRGFVLPFERLTGLQPA
jgi:hypothetical protein